MKRFLSGLLVLLLVCSTGLPRQAWAAATTNLPTRVIHVVYDDSGSMYETGNKDVDTWCQAKYAMEVFAAMLGEKDTLKVYYMSDYEKDTKKAPRLTLQGKDGAAQNVKMLHDQKTVAGNTPFASVKKAYSDLQSLSADEKWLVILTDGAFQGVDGKEGIDSYLAGKSSDVKVMFLGMGPKADGITQKASQDIFYVKAETNSEILSQITGICTRIFNSNRLDVSASSKNFSFDIPMSELIVFAQGANVDIAGIKPESGKLIKCAKSPVKVMYSDCDATNYKNKPTKDLVGSMATFIDDFAAGNYTLDVSGAETIEIYYKPNIEVAAYLTDANGQEVTDAENLEDGEYVLTFGFVKAGTDEKVAESKLLGNVTYNDRVTNNGTLHDKIYSSGDLLTVEEGTLQIDVTANYLEYNTVTTQLYYSVFRNKTVTFEVLDNPSYTVDSDGILEQDEIRIKAKLDGQEFTQEQWDRMELPAISWVDTGRDFKIEDPVLEKTTTPGIFTLQPGLPDGRPSTGTYKDCTYRITYYQELGKETWSGEMTEVVRINDLRSWWERNWDLFVKLVGLGIILFILAGYLPIFKNYLPKSLKKRPYIYGTSSNLNDEPKERKGTVKKNVPSTIIPYISQRGTIKYVPEGGFPLMKVRAIKGRRMTLTNIRAFAGRENIKFDGESIEKESKKYETGASVTITATKGDWTYECTPNQS